MPVLVNLSGPELYFPQLQIFVSSLELWGDFMSISAVFRVSKTSSIVWVSVVESFGLCGRR